MANMFRLRIRELREANGYKSQQSFADAFGIAQSTVGGWEAGKREPNFDTALRIASFFGVTTDYLLGCETEQPADIEIARGEVLTDEEHDVLLKFRALSPANRLKLVGYLDALADTAPVKKSYNSQVSNA